MRLAMIVADGKPRPAVMAENGGFVDLRASGFGWTCLEEIIALDRENLREIENLVLRPPSVVDSPALLAPLSHPEKIMCIGKNYADHCRELNSPLPQRPVLFAKYANALAGPGQVIELPGLSAQADYEAELAVVIGKKCRNVREEEALSAVFGYCCANDLTLRDVQAADGQWTRAKSPDSFCPVGPVIVTAEEIDNPQNLAISLTLNGTLMQNSNTGEMVFGVARLISHLSATMTLRPGDLLLTGTPSGVGVGRDPQVFLKKGDKVCVEIEKIGVLENSFQ